MAKVKTERNKSFIGVLQFVFKIMDKKDKFTFCLLSFAYALNGFFKLLPTQITAMLVSLIAGENASIFGIPISSSFNLSIVILLSALGAFIPQILSNYLGYEKHKFSMAILLKTKRTAYDWATTPRKNLNLGMTIGDATYRINDSVKDIDFVLTSFFDTILPQFSMAIMSAVFVCAMEIWSLPVLCGGLIVSVLIFLVRQKLEIPITINMEKNGARVTNFLVNSLGNLSLINIYQSQKLESEHLSNFFGVRIKYSLKDHINVP
jgi:hypothetical protein